jgi:hypothetical protein
MQWLCQEGWQQQQQQCQENCRQQHDTLPSAEERYAEQMRGGLRQGGAVDREGDLQQLLQR